MVAPPPAAGFRQRLCERVGPVQGSKIPKIGKEGFGVQKLPFPKAAEKGDLSQKIRISLQGSTRKMGIFRLKSPFSAALGNGSFWTPKPSFPDFGDFDPCAGPTRSQLERLPSLSSFIDEDVNEEWVPVHVVGPRGPWARIHSSMSEPGNSNRNSMIAPATKTISLGTTLLHRHASNDSSERVFLTVSIFLSFSKKGKTDTEKGKTGT